MEKVCLQSRTSSPWRVSAGSVPANEGHIYLGLKHSRLWYRSYRLDTDIEVKHSSFPCHLKKLLQTSRGKPSGTCLQKNCNITIHKYLQKPLRCLLACSQMWTKLWTKRWFSTHTHKYQSRSAEEDVCYLYGPFICPTTIQHFISPYFTQSIGWPHGPTWRWPSSRGPTA